MFEHCESNPDIDSHFTLIPICANCKTREDMWEHDKDNEYRHDFIAPEDELVWGVNAWRENSCPVSVPTEPNEFHPDGYLHCLCPCHWGKYYVNVYEVTQAYGGPEEGGWWYECGIPIASVPFDSFKEAVEYQGKMMIKYPFTKNRYSAADRGDDYDVLVQKHYGQEFPEETPRYS